MKKLILSGVLMFCAAAAELTGMSKQLTAGDNFPPTLHFARAGDVTTTVTVRKIGDSHI